ncbi:MAG: hypothetical protein ACKVRP_03010 [Bacteroidota bacterium]
MTRLRLFCCIALFCMITLTDSHFSLSQSNPDTSDSGQTFLPGGILVPPLIAQHQEPRVGVRMEFGSTRLKLDIGTTLDIVEFRLSEETRLRVGVDFFTYALTTSSQGLRLQVDAVDGFFGGHFTLQSKRPDHHWAVRLRLMHLSAHFLDGHYDLASNTWKDNRAPLAFTKDFGEVVGLVTTNIGSVEAMLYSGLSYATLIRPTEIKRFASLHGLQIHSNGILGQTFGKPTNLYLAYGLSLTGVPKYTASNNIECGIKFGPMDSAGVKLYFSYTSGLEVFSQYYDQRREYWGAGFAFDFW